MIKAELYKSTKELFRDDASEVGNDLLNTAEAALAEEKKEEIIQLAKKSPSLTPFDEEEQNVKEQEEIFEEKFIEEIPEDTETDIFGQRSFN